MMISKVLWPGKNHSVSVLSGGSTDSAIAEKEIVYLLYIDFDFMPINLYQALRVISIKFLLVIFNAYKQGGHENCGHDHTRSIKIIFYQLLPTTSVGNE